MGNIFDKSSSNNSKSFVMAPLLEETQFFALCKIFLNNLFNLVFYIKIFIINNDYNFFS